MPITQVPSQISFTNKGKINEIDTKFDYNMIGSNPETDIRNINWITPLLVLVKVGRGFAFGRLAYIKFGEGGISISHY